MKTGFRFVPKFSFTALFVLLRFVTVWIIYIYILYRKHFIKSEVTKIKHMCDTPAHHTLQTPDFLRYFGRINQNVLTSWKMK